MTAPVCLFPALGPARVRRSLSDFPRAAIASPFLQGARNVLPFSRNSFQTRKDIDAMCPILRRSRR
jgi:hypothetical protein